MARKFGNRYYKRLGKSSHSRAVNVADVLRNRGLNARVVRSKSGSTVFFAPKIRYNRISPDGKRYIESSEEKFIGMGGKGEKAMREQNLRLRRMGFYRDSKGDFVKGKMVPQEERNMLMGFCHQYAVDLQRQNPQLQMRTAVDYDELAEDDDDYGVIHVWLVDRQGKAYDSSGVYENEEALFENFSENGGFYIDYDRVGQDIEIFDVDEKWVNQQVQCGGLRVYEKVLNIDDWKADDREHDQEYSFDRSIEEINRATDVMGSDVEYLNRGEQRWVFKPRPGIEGTIGAGNVMKWNRWWQSDPVDDVVERVIGGKVMIEKPRQGTGFWEDHVTAIFERKYPFMLKYIVPAYPVPASTRTAKGSAVIQPEVEVAKVPGWRNLSPFDNRRYEFYNRWIQRLENELNMMSLNGTISEEDREEIEKWAGEVDPGFGNFSADGRLLDYYDAYGLKDRTWRERLRR